MPAQEIQKHITRMKYTNGLFLTENEFNLEQQYHIRMRRLNHSWFRNAGIAQGLEVEDTPNKQGFVTIKKGVAIDQYTVEIEESKTKKHQEMHSREIILTDDYDLNLYQSDYKEVNELFITINYAEKPLGYDADLIDSGTIYWNEYPQVLHSANAPNDRSTTIILARVKVKVVNQGIEVLSIHYEDSKNQPLRKIAGLNANELTTDKVTFKCNVEEAIAPFIQTVEARPNTQNPGLEVDAQHTQFTGGVSVEEAVELGNPTLTETATLTVLGKTQLGTAANAGGLVVEGPTNLKHELNIDGKAVLTKSLQVNGETRIGQKATIQSLEVQENSLLQNTVVKGDLEITGLTSSKELEVAEKATMQDTEILGDSTLHGNLDIGSEENQSLVNIEGKVAIKHPIKELKKGEQAEPSLTVSGDIAFNDPKSTFIIEGDCIIKGKLETAGKDTIFKGKQVSFADETLTLGQSDPEKKLKDVPLSTNRKGFEVFRGRTAGKDNDLASMLWVEERQKWECGLGADLRPIPDEKEMKKTFTKHKKILDGLNTEIDTANREIEYIKSLGSSFAGRSYPAMLALLAKSICTDDPQQRKSNMLTIPATDKASIFSYTLGAGLDVARSAYAMALEFYDFSNFKKGTIGDQKSLFLDSLFEAEEMANFIQMIREGNQRAKGFLKPDGTNRQLLLAAAIDALMTTVKEYCYRHKIKVDLEATLVELSNQFPAFSSKGQTQQVNYPLARKMILEKVFQPLFDFPDPNIKKVINIVRRKSLNHRTVERMKEFLLILARNIWKLAADDFFFTSNNRITLEGIGMNWLKDGTFFNLSKLFKNGFQGSGLSLENKRDFKASNLQIVTDPSSKESFCLICTTANQIMAYRMSRFLEKWLDPKFTFNRADFTPDFILKSGEPVHQFMVQGSVVVLSVGTKQRYGFQAAEITALFRAAAKLVPAPGKAPTLSIEAVAQRSWNFNLKLLLIPSQSKTEIFVKEDQSTFVYRIPCLTAATTKTPVVVNPLIPIRAKVRKVIMGLSNDQIFGKSLEPVQIRAERNKYVLLNTQEMVSKTFGIMLGHTGGPAWWQGSGFSWVNTLKFTTNIHPLGVLGPMFVINDVAGHHWTWFPLSLLLNQTPAGWKGNFNSLINATKLDGVPLFAMGGKTPAPNLPFFKGNVLDIYNNEDGTFSIKTTEDPWITVYQIGADGLPEVKHRISDPGQSFQIAHQQVALPEKQSALWTLGVRDNQLSFQLIKQ